MPRLAKICELLERRELLTGSPAYLQGTVFDNSNNPLAGATVTLYPHGIDTPAAALASVTTGADGNYQFTTASVGSSFTTGNQYDLIETPPAGYSNSATQSNVQVSGVTSTLDSFSVDIPASTTATVNVQNTFGPGGFYNNFDAITYTFDGTAESGPVMQFPATVNGNSYLTFCADPISSLDFGTNQYMVLPTTNFNPPSNYGERIAYLYDKYAASPQTSLDAQQATGLQIAIWTLLYDAGGNLDNGGFVVNDFDSATSSLTTQDFINFARLPRLLRLCRLLECDVCSGGAASGRLHQRVDRQDCTGMVFAGKRLAPNRRSAAAHRHR